MQKCCRAGHDTGMKIWRIALRAEHLRLQIHTQNIFHCNHGCTKAPQCYVIPPVPCLTFCLITPNVKNLNWKIVYACVARMSANDDTATGRSRLNISHQMARFHGDVTYAVVGVKMATRDKFVVECVRSWFVRFYCVRARINLTLYVSSDYGKK